MKYKIMAIIVVLIVALVEWVYWTKTNDAFTTVPVVSGVVIDKEAEDYGCGKHKRYTCYNYLLTIDGTNYIVEKELFLHTKIGESVDLTKTYVNEKPMIAVFSIGLHWAFSLIFGVLGVIGIINFILWASQDKLTYKQYTKKNIQEIFD